MNLPTASEAEIQELGGEPLEGSGFENERSSSAFEQREQRTEEGIGQ